MTLRPLPKTVAPVPDELLSGWLIRLASINYCEVDELLAHIGIAVRHPATFDFEVNMVTLETVLPFILFKPVWWFLTAPIWYGLARLATKLNPNGHHVFAVMMQVTPMAILRKGRRHVS